MGLTDITKKQKILGVGLGSIVGLGYILDSKYNKKKLPSGGIADYLKSLGGGGGGGGGGGMRSASPKPSSQDEEGEEETTDFIDEAGEPSSLLDIFNISVDDGPTTEEEAQLELQELQEEYSDIADITYDDDDGLNIDWNLNPGFGGLAGGLPFLEQTVANPPEGMAITTNPIPEGTSPFFSGDWNLLSPDWDSGLNQGPDYDYYMGPDQQLELQELQEEYSDIADITYDDDDGLNIDWNLNPGWGSLGGGLPFLEQTVANPPEGMAIEEETPLVYGCTNSASHSYNPAATIDDGSCLFYSGRAEENGEGEIKSKLDSWLQQFKDEESDDEEITNELPIIGTPPPALIRRLDNQQYPRTVTLARFRQ